jgi:hypothetical protein
LNHKYTSTWKKVKPLSTFLLVDNIMTF